MMHLLLDLYGCSADLLADEAHLRRFLGEMPGHIQMQQVSPVELRYIGETTDPRDAGYSGFVLIATSHVSLHAWPPYGMVNIDIFSCNAFNQAEAVAFVRTMFGPADIEMRLVQRAIRSPRRVNQAASDLADTATQSPLSLDQCLYPGCARRTGRVEIPYCEEHRGAPLEAPTAS